MDQLPDVQDQQKKVRTLVFIFIALLAVPIYMIFRPIPTETNSAEEIVSPETVEEASVSDEKIVESAGSLDENVAVEKSDSGVNGESTTEESPTERLAKQEAEQPAGIETESNSVEESEQSAVDTAAKILESVKLETQEADEATEIVPEKGEITTATEGAENVSPSPAFGVTEVVTPPTDDVTGNAKTCKMEEWDVQFTCDLSWEVLDKNKESLRVVLSKDPFITLSWKKIDKNLRFLNQLNRTLLDNFELYKEGFQLEPVEFSGHQAILVKGFSKEAPDVQMRDYYYLHNNKLVGVFFRLSPSEKWEDGKLIIKRVKDSFVKL